MSRSRLPLPPVPVASRGPGPAARPVAPPAPGPLTSVAPFAAVPSPEPRPTPPADDALFSAPVPAGARGNLLERPARVQSTPVPARPKRSWPDDEPALVSTGPSGLRSTGPSGLRSTGASGLRSTGPSGLGSTGPAGLRTSGPLPRVPSQTTSSGSSAPAYGDWTKPSEPQDVEALPSVGSDAPGTSAIPERSVRRRSTSSAAPAQVRGPGTGPVGGRAAMRAERQAADAVRRKAEGTKGSAVAVLEEGDRRTPRHVLMGLVAMTVVALGVLGVYSFVSPETKDAAAQTTATNLATTAPAVPDVAALPALPTDPIEVEPVAAAPVRVPVTVLNSTGITGLAAKVSATVAAGGWETTDVGAYPAEDVAASTVFYTDGDETQRQAAEQLVEMFPELQGPTARFFEVPADVSAPGIVVVTAGDWQP